MLSTDDDGHTKSPDHGLLRGVVLTRGKGVSRWMQEEVLHWRVSGEVDPDTTEYTASRNAATDVVMQ